MSAYNILVGEVQCPYCGKKYESEIQFKFGDTWQIRYQIGDKIKWGGNDIGKVGLQQVKVYGILKDTKCPNCLKENPLEEFDIFIENDIIKSVDPLSNIRDYGIENDYNYSILKE